MNQPNPLANTPARRDHTQTGTHSPTLHLGPPVDRPTLSHGATVFSRRCPTTLHHLATRHLQPATPTPPPLSQPLHTTHTPPRLVPPPSPQLSLPCPSRPRDFSAPLGQATLTFSRLCALPPPATARGVAERQKISRL